MTREMRAVVILLLVLGGIFVIAEVAWHVNHKEQQICQSDPIGC